MDKLFRNYVIGILLIILGQIINLSSANYGVGYAISGVLIALLFIISIKTELMKKREFLFMQLGLISVFFLPGIINFISILFIINFDFSSIRFSIDSKLLIFKSLLEISGYLISILCLIRYITDKDK
jgi:hypothetical protein